MNTHEYLATQKFDENFNCSQSVLYAFKDKLPVAPEQLLAIAAGFGGGIARYEEICGAVSGGIMALGLLLSDQQLDPIRHKEQTYAKTRVLMDSFKKTFGSYLCRDLLGECNHQTEAGRAAYKANDIKNKVCRKCVAEAAKITASLI